MPGIVQPMHILKCRNCGHDDIVPKYRMKARCPKCGHIMRPIFEKVY